MNLPPSTEAPSLQPASETARRHRRAHGDLSIGHVGTESAKDGDTGLPDSLPAGIRPYVMRGELVGWKVRLHRQGRHIARNFRAAGHGGLEEALREAHAFLDEANRAFPCLSSVGRGITLRSDNTSGVPGVSRACFGPNDHSWVAFVLIGGRKRSKTFSIRKYGDEGAFQLAVEARRKLLEAASPGPHDLRQGRETSQTAGIELADLLRIPAGGTPRPNPYASFTCEAPGVYLKRHREKRKDGTERVTPYWVATIRMADGRHNRRYFSVRRWGEEAAKRKAIEQRRAWEAAAMHSTPRGGSPTHSELGYAVPIQGDESNPGVRNPTYACNEPFPC